MSAFEKTEQLALLEDCGIRVDLNGLLSDWQDRPPTEARPLEQQPDGTRGTRNAFTREDDHILHMWCIAAQQQGVLGTQVFEQLEVLRPGHTWQAYQTRWRKTLRQLPAPPIVGSHDLPGLRHPPIPDQSTIESTAIAMEQSLGEGVRTSVHENLIESEETTTLPTGTSQRLSGIIIRQPTGDSDTRTSVVNYSDQRVEIGRVMLSKLELRDDGELRLFLQQPWVLTIYVELRQGRSPDGLSLLDGRESGSPCLLSQSPHRWKVERAGFFFSPESQSSSRYSTTDPDTSAWTEDDFDIRFLVRAVILGSARLQIWERERQTRGWRPLCEKALWLLLWFKWLHKTTFGLGREMERLRRKKGEWLKYLNEIEQKQHNTVEIDLTTTASLPSTTTTGAAKRREDLQRQLFLISEDARQIYARSRDARLALWGVDSTHASTCILVPSMWSLTDPRSLAGHPEVWPMDDTQLARMSFSVGAYNFLWARWVAWFESWPRTTQDLQSFLPPTTVRREPSQMHGSHRCHHGLCVVPSHIAYEEWSINIARNACVSAAHTLRMYGAAIPKYCRKHEPPCLLQLAALTAYESFAVQFNVLTIAKDLPARAPLARPSHHPERFASFFQGPGPSDEFPAIGASPEDIVRLSNLPPTQIGRGFQRNCVLCPYVRTFGSITTLWAHLRAAHSDHSTSDVLQEVVASARAYQGWADERSYAYARSNGATWQKVQQAQSPGFDWAAFCGWRLSRLRRNLRQDGLARFGSAEEGHEDEGEGEGEE